MFRYVDQNRTAAILSQLSRICLKNRHTRNQCAVYKAIVNTYHDCHTRHTAVLQYPNNLLHLQRAFLSSDSNQNTVQATRPFVHPTLSYSFGKSNDSLSYSTVGHAFDQKTNETPDEIAIISHEEDRVVSYKQLRHDVDMLVKGLVTKFGIKKGDFVGVFAYNCYNWTLIQYACSKLGAVLVPVNPSYKSDELMYVMKKGKIKCLFLPGPKSKQAKANNHLEVLQNNEIVDMSKKGELLLEHVVLMDSERDYDIKELHFKLVKCSLSNWSSLQNDAKIFSSNKLAIESGVKPESALILNPNSISPDDPFAVYFTSGTTGRPKGACVSQFTVLNTVRFSQMRVRGGRPKNWKATVASVLPLFHIFSGVLNALSPLVSNTTIVWPGHLYDIKMLVQSIIKHSANVTTLTPTILIDLLAYVEQSNLGPQFPLKVIQPGGAFLPPELVSKAFAALPNLEDIRPGYGSTENGAVASIQTIYEPNETRATSVGSPLDFCEIRVVKADGNNELLPHNEIGEIQTRGFNCMIGYLDEPTKTKEVITENRWYRTGDVGLMYPHGSITICGRTKHMIIKGGENIYPDEVEQFMHKIPCIEKVHVVGVPDERYGEQVCAWVKLKHGYTELKQDASARRSDKEVHRDDIINFCKENITYFKVPKYLFFVDDFPMTPTKKVQRHLMAEQSIKWIGLKK